MEHHKLDAIDLRILYELQENGRITNVELSRRAKITAPPCLRRMRSLEKAGYIKGYHAEQREEGVFAAGVQRLLDNVMKTLTATSVMSLSASVLLGLVGAATMYVGARQSVAGTMTPGQLDRRDRANPQRSD